MGDILKLTVLGSGAAIPDGEGVQSGYLVSKEGESPVLVDCGSGVVHRIGQSSVSVLDIDTVFISHPHPDHVLDIVSLVQARRLQDRPDLKVFGPSGTRKTVKELLGAMDLWGKSSVEVTHLDDGSEYVINGYQVEALKTKHSIPSFAFRFDGDLVYTGDTEKFSGLSEFLGDARVVIHDASFPVGSGLENHVSVEDIRDIVRDLDVERLILSHFYPGARESVDESLDYLGDVFSGVVVAANDLDEFSF